MEQTTVAPIDELKEYESLDLIQTQQYSPESDTNGYIETEDSETKEGDFEYPIFEDVPNYQLPNFSAMLGAFGSMEQDYIKQAYDSASFTSLRKLPNQFRYGEVYLARQNQILKTQLTNSDLHTSHAGGSIASNSQRKSFGSSTRVRAMQLFQEFKYMPSRYSLSDEMKAKERMIAEEKRLQIAGKAFVPSSSRTKTKYEDTFEDEDYRYPYCSDPFELSRDQHLRDKWINDSKILFGPFKPTGSRHLQFSQATIALKEHVLNRLRKIISEDWGDAEFQVTHDTDSKWIVISFAVTSVESTEGLQAYMNVLQSSNADLCSWGLKKVTGSWGITHTDGYQYYCFSPPWSNVRK